MRFEVLKRRSGSVVHGRVSLHIGSMSRFRGRCEADSLAGFRTKPAEPAVPGGLLKGARKSGQLNLSGRGLKEGNFSSKISFTEFI